MENSMRILKKLKTELICVYAQSRPTLCNLWTAARQIPLPMEFSREEYWNRVPFSTPGNFSNPGIKSPSPESPALAGRFFTTWRHWN